MISRKDVKNTNGDISLVISKKDPSTNGQDGALNITVKGGKAPYTLVVNTSTRSSELVYKGEKFDLTNLPKGFYLLSVTDSEGNFTTQTINL